MNTFDFIKTIGKLFSGNNVLPSSNNHQLSTNSSIKMENNNNNQMIQGDEKPQNRPNIMPDLRPTVQTTPRYYPVNLPSSEVERVSPKDLMSVALMECAKSEGNLNKLWYMIQVVAKSYKMEAIEEEQTIKEGIVREINIRNNRIIELNNQIAEIHEFRIPDLQKELNVYTKEAERLLDNGHYQTKTELGSELFTVLRISEAMVKEKIRNNQSKIIQLKTAIDQEKNAIDILNLKINNINLFNKDVLSRRLDIFFSGWLDGLVGIGASDEEIEKTNQYIKRFWEDEMDEFFKKIA
jgi:hypothetical protein